MYMTTRQQRPIFGLAALTIVAAGAAGTVHARMSDDPALQLIAETSLLATRSGPSAVDARRLPPDHGADTAHANLRPNGEGFAQRNAVGSDMLDDMRGGFASSLNLRLSFGIERAVYMNGTLVTTTSFNLPSFGDLIQEHGVSDAPPANSVVLLQNGPGNSFAIGAPASSLVPTVIQNTLNNQTIQTLTTVNATANSLGVMRTAGFNGLIQESVIQAIVPR